ncbi:uncharacterized protein [Halyomorpha halys]|uniref:uncharacterized protein isoform X3 n=1 Tax=Halyomorpha halys TaxID=286706 RepID=UPI0006D4CADA|nr:uncharacterized protein LOC106683604 isoform X2 [Halyomorpha halys]
MTGKWQTSPVSNPPLENLKTFLQKRIRAIMAKEWWDFIVNVNTLNSDHASLLYSLANLCPSFNYFLQTRDRELQLIIKKRPVVKPRIFSGSERLDTTPEPIVPKQMPLVTRRNSATELVKILNELYPNENNTKSKSRTYGPASKQKKTPGPAKKNAVTNNITGEVTKKNSPVHANLARTPLLKRLLADESQKENAHVTNLKKMPQLLSMPVILEDDEKFSKAILANTNYDLNQNRCLNQSPRKIKKIIKVKKKRYVYSNSLTDSKHRLKYILEDETPNLSLKLIKKYRIKKCTVDIVRLRDSVLKYYEDLRWRNCEKLRLSLEESSSLIPNEETQLCVSDVTDQHSNSNIITNSPPTIVPSEKYEEVSEKNISDSCKENAPVVEKFDPKELKNMYCHGGIVPLGKLLMSDKVGNSKHFLSLKEKKIRDISNDAAIFLKPRALSPKTESGEIETKNSNNKTPDLDRLHLIESSSKVSSIDSKGNEPNISNTCIVLPVLDGNNLSNGTDKESETVQQMSVEEIRKSPTLELENTNISSNVESGIANPENMDVNETLAPTVSESCNKIVSHIDNDATEPTLSNCSGDMTVVSNISHNEAPPSNVENVLDINDVELTIACETSPEAEKSESLPQVEKLIGVNNKSETVSDLSPPIAEENKILELDTLLNGPEDIEPLAKRPRIEIDLSEMKVVTDITKNLAESGNSDDRVCKMCKSSFESVESWNEHFENKVPKCTPNLQVSWDNPEHSLLTD